MPPNVTAVRFNTTLHLISNVKDAYPTANSAHLDNHVSTVLMDSCMIQTLHNASVHLHKEEPSSSTVPLSFNVLLVAFNATILENALTVRLDFL